MDTRAPHNIKDIADVPPEERKHFVPIPEAEAVDLKAMTPKERAEWLRNRRQRTIDKARASAVAQSVYDGKMRQISQLSAMVKESKREKKSVSSLLGYVIGTRAFIDDFLIEEAAIRDVLEERCGVSRSDYQRAVEMHLRHMPKPRLHEVIDRLINEAPVFEYETKLWGDRRPDLPIDAYILHGQPSPEADEDAGGLAAPEPEPESSNVDEDSCGLLSPHDRFRLDAHPNPRDLASDYPPRIPHD